MPKAERIDLPADDAGQLSENAREAFDEALDQRIRLAAHYRAMRRGFAPGGEEEDWYAAEEEERQRNAERPA